MVFEIIDGMYVESGYAHFLAATCAHVQVHVPGCAAFLTAGFAYQSCLLLLRIAAFYSAPIGFLVFSFACSAFDQALAIQAT